MVFMCGVPSFLSVGLAVASWRLFQTNSKPFGQRLLGSEAMSSFRDFSKNRTCVGKGTIGAFIVTNTFWVGCRFS